MNNITRIKLLFSSLLLVFLFGSCQKDIIDKFEQTGENWSNLESFYQSVNTARKIDIDNAENGFILPINDQVIIDFNDYSFKSKNNQKVNGTIRVELNKLNSNGLIILNKMNTTSYEPVPSILFAMGMLDIKFFQNGNEILIDPISEPVIYVKGTEEYLESFARMEWLEDNQQAGWFPHLQPSYDYIQYDIEKNGVKYSGSGFKFNYSAVEPFCLVQYQSELYEEDENFSDVTVDLEEAIEDIDIYLVYKNRNSVRKMNRVSDSTFHTDRVLINEEVSVIALGVENENLLFDKFHFVAQEKNEVNVKLKETDYIALINELKNL